MTEPRMGFFERLLVNLVITRFGLKDKLKGRKTYLIGALMVLQGLYALIAGEAPTYANPSPVSSAEAFETISIGLGFATGRAGIAKAEEEIRKNGK